MAYPDPDNERILRIDAREARDARLQRHRQRIHIEGQRTVDVLDRKNGVKAPPGGQLGQGLVQGVRGERNRRIDRVLGRGLHRETRKGRPGEHRARIGWPGGSRLGGAHPASIEKKRQAP